MLKLGLVPRFFNAVHDLTEMAPSNMVIKITKVSCGNCCLHVFHFDLNLGNPKQNQSIYPP